MKSNEFINARLYPLVFSPNKDIVTGEITSYSAIVQSDETKDESMSSSIFQKFIVKVDISTPEDRYFAQASFRKGLPAVEVESFEEGIELCKGWYSKYWHDYLELLAREVVCLDTKEGSTDE